MKPLPMVLAALFALVAVYTLAGMLLPDRSVLEHRVDVDAPPAAVHALAADLSRFEAWSPFGDAMPHLSAHLIATADAAAALEWRDRHGRVRASARIVQTEAPALLAARIEHQGGAARAELHIQPVGQAASTLVARVVVEHQGTLSDRWRALLVGAGDAPELERALQRLRRLVHRDAVRTMAVAEPPRPEHDAIGRRAAAAPPVRS